MYRHQEGFESRNTRITLISFQDIRTTREITNELGIPFRILIDEYRRTYHRYGLERSYRRSYSPRTILFYVKHVLRGERIQRTNADVAQLGGDFIIDRERIIRYAHISRDPLDRPTIEELTCYLTYGIPRP